MEYVVGRVWIDGLDPWCGLDVECWKVMFNRCTIVVLLSLAIPVVLFVFHWFSFGEAFNSRPYHKLWVQVRHTFSCSVTMTRYDNRKGPICSKIRSLLIFLTKAPAEYDEIAPMIEYWIEYVLREQFATVDELVEGVSGVAWDGGGSFISVVRFLKEFYDAPQRSEQARSFVVQLCTYVLRWFAIACVEGLWMDSRYVSTLSLSGHAFIRAASFVGHLIEWSLLEHDLVRRHLIKPLTYHEYNSGDKVSPETVRANAIYQLFITAGNTLLQGLLEPKDAQVCFKILNIQREWINGFESAKLQV